MTLSSPQRCVQSPVGFSGVLHPEISNLRRIQTPHIFLSTDSANSNNLNPDGTFGLLLFAATAKLKRSEKCCSFRADTDFVTVAPCSVL